MSCLLQRWWQSLEPRAHGVRAIGRRAASAALASLGLALAGCGGSDNATPAAVATQEDAVDAAAGQGQRIALATPEAVEGTNRIALRWSAHGQAQRYSVLLKRSANEDYGVLAEDLAGGSAVIVRGPAWQFDFPTARVKVRGCNRGGRCIDSNEQPLLGALMDGIVALRSGQPDPTWNVNDPNGTVNVAWDFFSLAVALDASGNRLAATARERIFVFDRGGNGAWQRTAVTSRTSGGEGVVVSADGNTMVVNDPDELGTYGGINPPPGPDDGDIFTSPFVGALYVYVRNAQGQWQQQAHIRQDARQGFESFGGAFALSADGNTLATTTGGNGRAYVFVRDGAGAWRQHSVVSMPPATNFESFQGAVALSGDGRTLALNGAGAEDPSFFSIYRFVDVYTRPAGGAWSRQGRLDSRKRALLDIDDFYGSSIAVDQDGTKIAVAAPEDDSDDSDAVGDPANRGAPASGAVYVFKRSGTAWTQQAFLKARQAARNDRFGSRVELSRTGKLLMGSALGLAANVPGVNRNHEADRVGAVPPGNDGWGGAAYFFEQRSDGTWTERATVLPPTLGRSAAAFFTIGLSGDGATYALGADALERVGDIVTQRARVYVY